VFGDGLALTAAAGWFAEPTCTIAAARTPVTVVVDPDPQASKAPEGTLARRFGQDYRIETAGSADTALHLLGRLADDHEDVGLVAAELFLDGVDGVEFIEQAHVLHPRAIRALLLAMDERRTRIPFGTLPAIQRATALGRIDLTL
jgi:thioredoxin reductase (NADPH)